MVPISKELSELINTYINKVEEYFPGKKNPENLIFIRYEGKKGVCRQILQLSFLRNLDKLPKKHI